MTGKDAFEILKEDIGRCYEDEMLIVENEINSLDILKKCGIALVVPESECLNNERLTIHLYKKHTTKEQWAKLLELFDIK